jgi:hypothetical protein
VDRLSNKDLRINAEVTDRLKKKFDADLAALEGRSQLSNSDSPSKRSGGKLRGSVRVALLMSAPKGVKKRATLSREKGEG